MIDPMIFVITCFLEIVKDHERYKLISPNPKYMSCIML